MLFNSQDGAQNMLVLRVISSIYWDETFDGNEVLQTGSYLYYNWNIVMVTVLPGDTVHCRTIPVVKQVYLQVEIRGTLAECEADVAEFRRVVLADEERVAHQKRERQMQHANSVLNTSK